MRKTIVSTKERMKQEIAEADKQILQFKQNAHRKSRENRADKRMVKHQGDQGAAGVGLDPEA